MKRMVFLLAALLLIASWAQAESVIGKWKQVDDETGDTESVIEIYEQNGKIYGKIVKLFRGPDEDPNPVCDKCTDDRQDQPLLGMEIIRGLQKDGDVYEADKGILDPKKGKSYDCKIWLEDTNTLKVRGSIAFFYRTQTWYRQ